jgi:DNA polymerase
MNQDGGARMQLLAEMRLGPTWLLRERPTGPLADQAMPAAEAVVSALSSALALDLPAKDEAEPVEMSTTAVPAQIPVADHGGADARAQAIAAMSWEELERSVAGCRACGLCEGRAKTVFGVGDRKAKWLFVGEGPGYNENLQGEPFVGPAGRLLDNMMRSLGMQRSEGAFIANVVKCRPTDEQGKDRPPSADEAAACLPYLRRQIELLQPEVIVALGKTAGVSLLGLDMETPVGQIRGKLHRYANWPMVVTYHPAYLLRKPIEKSKAWSDLCIAAKASGTQE